MKLDVTRDAHSLESLYRPLAMPHLLEALEKLVTKIKVLWRQLHFPEAQRGPLTARIQIVNRENYTLLVSHMLLLQSAHTQLVSIINKIRLELVKITLLVLAPGAHVSPSENRVHSNVRNGQPGRCHTCSAVHPAELD